MSDNNLEIIPEMSMNVHSIPKKIVKIHNSDEFNKLLNKLWWSYQSTYPFQPLSSRVPPHPTLYSLCKCPFIPISPMCLTSTSDTEIKNQTLKINFNLIYWYCNWISYWNYFLWYLIFLLIGWLLICLLSV